MSNETIIETIKRQLESHEKRIAELERMLQAKPDIATAKHSIKDFLQSKKPKDDLQKTLVIGYYLEKYKGLSPFTVKDIENGFMEAREFTPQNINDKVNKNIEKKYMMQAKEKKDKKMAWVLTALGQKYIESDLQEAD